MKKITNVALGECTTTQMKALLGLGETTPGTRNDLVLLATQPEVMRRLIHEACSEEGESVPDPLAEVSNPQTTTARLAGIKNWTKTVLGRSLDEGRRTAVTILYHAAIAAAFAHHGEEISTLPIDSRWVLYQDLADALAGDPLAAVFRACADRIEEERPAEG
jgi:hypothetical protein